MPDICPFAIRMLKQVHPGMEILRQGLFIMNDLVVWVLGKLAAAKQVAVEGAEQQQGATDQQPATQSLPAGWDEVLQAVQRAFQGAPATIC